MNLSLRDDSGPAPANPSAISERDKADRKIVVLLICLVIVAVVGLGGTAALLWIHYSTRYTNIDKSHEKLSWNLNQSQSPSTTYANPPYGVTLKLPGRWVRVPPPYPCFVTLAGSPDSSATHFDVMFWPIFTGLPSSVDTQAMLIGAAYSRGAGWKLEKSETMQIDGRNAHVMSFATQEQNLSLTLAVLNKGFVTYALIFAGPENAPDDWRQIHEALPQAVSLR
jgi:hypothetical protein